MAEWPPAAHFVLVVHAGHDAAEQRRALGEVADAPTPLLRVDARARKAWPLLAALDVPLRDLPRAWHVRAPLEAWCSRPWPVRKRPVATGGACGLDACHRSRVSSLTSLSRPVATGSACGLDACDRSRVSSMTSLASFASLSSLEESSSAEATLGSPPRHATPPSSPSLRVSAPPPSPCSP